jgi:acetyltransferase
MHKHELDYFFYPDGIAVIGASNSLGKAGYQVLKNLTTLGYEGRVYPVNPKEDTIKGLPCYASLKDISDKIELAIITIPAQFVNGIVEEIVQRGDIKAIVVVSAGFSETKTEEGVTMEKALVEMAAKAGIRVFGPNCTGVINTANALDTTIEPTVEQVKGGVSVFSQSGGMAGSILLFAEIQPRPLGFAKWAHVGNMCDVDALDVLRYYGTDEETKVVVMYMEGFNEGRKLMEVTQEITSHKPVIILKVGRTELGSKAAFSHTGALAGSDAVYDAAFHKVGITRVNDLFEMIDTAKAMSMMPLPNGHKICILSEAGGPGTMAMDELGKYAQAQIAHISQEGQKELKEKMPSMSLICQPDGYLDISAAAMESHHCEALEIVLAEPDVDGVILISVPPTFLPPEDLAEALIPVIKKSSKPILTCLLAGKWVAQARKMMEAEGIPTFDTPEQAVRALVNMIDRGRFLQKSAAKRGDE